MLSRYCAAQVDQKHKNGSLAKEYSPLAAAHQNDDTVKSESLACPSVPLTQVSSVISAYDEAISKLLKSGKKELVAQAMSELGDMMWHSDHSKTAGHWWREVLETVTGKDNLTSAIGGGGDGGWRKLMESNSGEALSQFGVWGCLLAALSATKLARLAISDSYM